MDGGNGAEHYVSDYLHAQISAFCCRLPKVVVVGAGPAGLNVARGLKGHADVIMIDGKGYHELNSGTLQTFITPAHGKQVLIDYKQIPDLGKVIHGKVVSVREGSVRVDNGAYTGQWDLEYDWLVLAPGSSYAEGSIKTFCGTLEQRQEIIQMEHNKLTAAESILIIGGGIVGVELAGEIATNMPEKHVTLVSSATRLMADKPPSIGQRSQDFLERKGVEVHVSTRVFKNESGQYATTSGRVFGADVVYMTVGGTPNTSFLKNSCIPLDNRGFVMVDQFLQVIGHPRIFAIGDANDVKETKLGYLAAGQGRLTALNLITRFTAGPSAELQSWAPFGGFEFVTGQAMLFTLGRPDGVAQGWFSSWLRMMGQDGWFFGWLRAKDEYTSATRRNLGVKDVMELDASKLVPAS